MPNIILKDPVASLSAIESSVNMFIAISEGDWAKAALEVISIVWNAKNAIW